MKSWISAARKRAWGGRPGMFPVLFALALAGINPGCETAQAPLKASGEVAVALDASKKSGSVTVRLANVVTFTMPPAAPGLAWGISFHDTRFLKQQTDFLPPKEAGAGSTVAFLATNIGSTRLRFVLVPVSTDRSVSPVDRQDVAITIR